MKKMVLVFIVLACVCELLGCSSREKEIQIGLKLSSYEKDGYPYTDVNFIIHSEDEEEEMLIGSYLGNGSMIESFENRAFFASDSIAGCQVYYAGGGDNVFAYLEDSKIKVKHNTFSEGSEEIPSEIFEERVVFTKTIPKNAVVKTLE